MINDLVFFSDLMTTWYVYILTNNILTLNLKHVIMLGTLETVTLPFWLYLLVMSRTRFRVDPHTIIAQMSRNYLLEAGGNSEVKHK